VANKKIEIIYDIDNKPIQVAIDKTLNLRQQVKALTSELGKTKEGTAEFRLLTNTLNETKDNLDRVNTKSRELFSTFSLIPGPIGDIAGKINGVIGLLKTFSGFKLSDVKNQFTELGRDLVGIANNILGLGEKADEAKDSLNQLGNAGGNISDNVNKISEANNNLTDSQNNVVSSTGKVNEALNTGTVVAGSAVRSTNDLNASTENLNRIQSIQMTGSLKATNATQLLTQAELAQIPITEKNAVTYALKNKIVTASELASRQAALASQQLAGATEAETVAAETATGAIETQAAVTETLTFAERAATFATNALKVALAGLGIGLVIAGVSYLVEKITEWYKDTTAVDLANKKLTDTLSSLKRQLDGTGIAIQDQTKLLVTLAKTAGKSANDIADIERGGFKQRIAALEDFRKKSAALALKIEGDTKITEEQKKKLREDNQKEFIEAGDKISAIQAQQRQFEADEQLKAAEAAKQLGKEGAATRKQQAEEDLAAKKAALDASIKLEIDKKNTEEDKLKELLDKRIALELDDSKKRIKLTEDQKQVLRDEYKKKLLDSLKEDNEAIRKLEIERADSTIEVEKNAILTNFKDVSDAQTQRLATLKSDLDARAQLEIAAKQAELGEEEITENQKLEIRQKYEKQYDSVVTDLRDKRKKDRLDELSKQLDETRGNTDAQIGIYDQFLVEIKDAEYLSAKDKLDIRKNAEQQILQLIDTTHQNELTKITNQYDAAGKLTTAYFDALSAEYDKNDKALQDQYDKGFINETEYTKRKQENAKARIDLDKAEQESALTKASVVSGTLNAVSELFGKQTVAGKAFAVAAATIDTYVGATKALAAYPPPFGAIAAAGVIISGLINVKKILAVQLPTSAGGGAASTSTAPVANARQPINVTAARGFADGGFIEGPGSTTSDSIPARLSDGEFVINAQSTRKFRPLLETINSYSALPSFSMGGLFGDDKQTKSSKDDIAQTIKDTINNQPLRTYVTAGDISSQQQFDRVIKSRSLI
jgi:hypothetical protein